MRTITTLFAAAALVASAAGAAQAQQRDPVARFPGFEERFPFFQRLQPGMGLPDRRVDIGADDVKLSVALERLFKDSGYAVRFEEGVKQEAKVTVVLKNVSFKTALSAICESAGVGFRPAGEKSVLITTRPIAAADPFGGLEGIIGGFPDLFRELPGLLGEFPGLEGARRPPIPGDAGGGVIFNAGGRGRALFNRRPLTYGTAGEEFIVDLEGPAKATVQILNKDGKALKESTTDLKEGKQKVSVKLADIPADGSARIEVAVEKSSVEIRVRDGGRSVAVKSVSTS